MAEDKFSIGQVLSHKLLGIMAEKGKLSFSDHIYFQIKETFQSG